MDSHIFEVELPEGHIVEVEAPQDTPQEHIRRRVYQEVLKNPDLSPSIAKQQGAGFKSPVYPSGTRTAGEVASDQAANVIKGIPKAILGIPGMVTDSLSRAGAANVDPATRKPVREAPRSAPTLPPSPDSPEWAQYAQAAGANLAGTELFGNVIPGAAPAVIQKTKAAFTKPPIADVTSALSPSDITFQKHASIAMDELKAAKTPINSVEDGLKAVSERHKVNDSAFKSIVEPQKDLDATTYRQSLIDAQVQAIPEGLTPAAKAKAVRNIELRTPKNLTIGALDDIRASMGAKNRTYRQKLSQGLASDETQAAVDAAYGDSSRNALYSALDETGLGGGEAAWHAHYLAPPRPATTSAACGGCGSPI